MTHAPQWQQPTRDVHGAVEPLPLPRTFYERGTISVARGLLGKVLLRGTTTGVIVETEAYLGGDDLASHSAAGITPRTRVIFGPPGHAYVYLSYGMHECLNIVAEPDGVAGCVLIRALEPLTGIDLMRKRRLLPANKPLKLLANGPGKLTQAMAITRADNGKDMTKPGVGDHGLTVHQPSLAVPFEIAVSPRIGITKCADLPLRFTVQGSPFLSR